MHGVSSLEVYSTVDISSEQYFNRSELNVNNVSNTDTVVAAAARWDGVIMTAQGGQYRLCWCGAGSPCSLVEHFRVDAGQLDFLGPSPLSQSRTCVSSRMCAFEMMTGHGLQSGDSFMVLDTCSTETTIPRFQRAGAVASATAAGRSVSWGNVSISAAGGEYRLCWCAANYFHCNSAQ